MRPVTLMALASVAYLAAVWLLAGCDMEVDSEGHQVELRMGCDEPDGPAAVDCMVRCAEAANPMSDEEGEALVEQCDRSCEKYACKKRALWVQYPRGGGVSCKLTQDPREIKACRRAGGR